MKFYKCHSTKFKNDKVFVMPEQFTEIGPDAFLQTNFEIIIICDNVTTIRDHAFSQISDCSIFVPTSVTEIEPLAFEGMGSYNVIFCEKNSTVHKTCIELDLNFDNDIGEIRRKAVEIKEIEEKKKKEAEERERQLREAERIKREAQEEAERIKQQALNVAKETVTQNKPEEIKKEAPKINISENKKTNVIHDAPIFIDEEHKQPSIKKPVAAQPIFIDEEHRNTQKSIKKDTTSIFRNIDDYDDELKTMQKSNKTFNNRSSSYVRPTTSSPRPEPKKPTTGSVMRNLDEYDDELKKMQQEKKKKGGWGFF